MIQKQNDIIETQNKLLEQFKWGAGQQQQLIVFHRKRYTSKEMACKTILNLLFEWKCFEYLPFRSFFFYFEIDEAMGH